MLVISIQYLEKQKPDLLTLTNINFQAKLLPVKIKLKTCFYIILFNGKEI